MILILHSVARWCYLHRIPLIPRLVKAVNFVLFSAVVPAECRIGSGTRLHHHALSIIIHPQTEIGRDCNIYNQVVIGGASDGPHGPAIRIVIGDRVTIAAGAKVLCKTGTLTIGEGSAVAANAVVLADVPPHSLAIGIPARCIARKSEHMSCAASHTVPTGPALPGADYYCLPLSRRTAVDTAPETFWPEINTSRDLL